MTNHSKTFKTSDDLATAHRSGEVEHLQVEPFNLRLTHRPLRCVTGLSIPPGLVGFCWETPLCLEVLQQQAPELATVVEHWSDHLKPILEKQVFEEQVFEKQSRERHVRLP